MTKNPLRFSQQAAAKSLGLGLDLKGKKMDRPATGAGTVDREYEVALLKAAKMFTVNSGKAISVWWAASSSVEDHGALFSGSKEDQNSTRRMLAEEP